MQNIDVIVEHRPGFKWPILTVSYKRYQLARYLMSFIPLCILWSYIQQIQIWTAILISLRSLKYIFDEHTISLHIESTELVSQINFTLG